MRILKSTCRIGVLAVGIATTACSGNTNSPSRENPPTQQLALHDLRARLNGISAGMANVLVEVVVLAAPGQIIEWRVDGISAGYTCSGQLKASGNTEGDIVRCNFSSVFANVMSLTLTAHVTGAIPESMTRFFIFVGVGP